MAHRKGVWISMTGLYVGLWDVKRMKISTEDYQWVRVCSVCSLACCMNMTKKVVVYD